MLNSFYSHFFTITPKTIQEGWTLTDYHLCPLLSLGAFPTSKVIYFPKQDTMGTVYDGNFTINEAGKANVFPPRHASTSKKTSVLAIIQVPTSDQDDIVLSLPFWIEDPCPGQGHHFRHNQCSLCSTRLPSIDYSAQGEGSLRYLHPDIEEVIIRYYPLLTPQARRGNGPQCYGRGKGTETTDFLVSFMPGECVRVSINEQQEEFLLYGKDGQWYRDQSFEVIQASGQYDMSHARDYLNALDGESLKELLYYTLPQSFLSSVLDLNIASHNPSNEPQEGRKRHATIFHHQ